MLNEHQQIFPVKTPWIGGGLSATTLPLFLSFLSAHIDTLFWVILKILKPTTMCDECITFFLTKATLNGPS